MGGLFAMRSAMIFNFLIEANIMASIAILLMIPLRKLLRKQMGNTAICFGWLLIALRLLIPLTLPNPLIHEIRPAYRFDETCQGTVPQAITAFLESTDFEDAIRNAISLGGDSDTLAAITGSIAEAAYGIPEWIKKKAFSYLDGPLKDVCRRWRKFTSPLPSPLPQL